VLEVRTADLEFRTREVIEERDKVAAAQGQLRVEATERARLVEDVATLRADVARLEARMAELDTLASLRTRERDQARAALESVTSTMTWRIRNQLVSVTPLVALLRGLGTLAGLRG